VVKYVETTGAISGRLGWFECYAGTSDFYRLVAKPLLSMGTVGSMDCERRAKPLTLKNTILTKDRNRMMDPTGVALLRPSSYHACEEDAWKEDCRLSSLSRNSRMVGQGCENIL